MHTQILRFLTILEITFKMRNVKATTFCMADCLVWLIKHLLVQCEIKHVNTLAIGAYNYQNNIIQTVNYSVRCKFATNIVIKETIYTNTLVDIGIKVVSFNGQVRFIWKTKLMHFSKWTHFKTHMFKQGCFKFISRKHQSYCNIELQLFMNGMVKVLFPFRVTW